MDKLKRKAREIEDDDDEDNNFNESDDERISRKKKSSSKHTKASKSTSIKKSKAIIEDEDDEDDDDDMTLAKKSKVVSKKSKKIIEQDDDEEEEEEGDDLDDDDDDEEEEDEDEEAHAEEFNDFIDDNADNDDEEAIDDDDDDIKRKKKKKDKKSKKKKKERNGEEENGSGVESSSSSSQDDLTDLEEDDLELIKDNLNVEDLEEVGIKKRNRVRIESDSDDEEKQTSAPSKSKKDSSKRRDKQQESSKKSSKDKSIKKHQKERRNDLDENEENEEEAEVNEEEEAEEDDEEKQISRNAEDSDEEGSFIVDDSDDDENKDGDGMRGNRQKFDKGYKKKKHYTDEAQQEAMDIFGVNAEELGAVSEDENEEEEEDEEDEDIGDDLIDDEGEENQLDEDDEDYQKQTKKRQRQRRQKIMHKLEDIFEPQELEKNLLTEFDQRIRIEDKPERFMLRQLPVTTEPNETELEKEAEWIYNQSFSFTTKQTVSNQEFSSQKPSTVIPKIKDVLNFIRNDFYEVPFIASYRKEHIRPELSVQDLWTIYEMDQKYCQLKIRKENLLKLYQRMQKYQLEQMTQLTNKQQELQIKKDTLANHQDDNNEELDETLVQQHQQMIEEEEQVISRLIDAMRVLDDTELDAIKNIQTVDEFLDHYHHFHLHYGSELLNMKEFEAHMAKSGGGKKKKTKKKTKQKKKKQPGEEGAGDDEDDEDDEDFRPDGEEENEEEEEEEIDEEIEEEDEEGQTVKFSKYASKRDKFHQCKIAGLNSFAKKFGLTPEQYGENLMADYQKHDVDQWGIEPGSLALDFVREPYFQTTEQVLTTVRYMVAIQLARDPLVRSCVRDLYTRHACINVRPTMPRGYKEIDEGHICYKFKYLKGKPCSDLKQDDYYKIATAEQDGLLTVKFELSELVDYSSKHISTNENNKSIAVEKKTSNNDDDWDDDLPSSNASNKNITDITNKQISSSSSVIPNSTSLTTIPFHRTILEKLKSFYHKDEFSYNVEQWNNQRALIIEEMCNTYLFPEFEKELRSKLLSEAKLYIFKESAKRLQQIIKVAPYTTDSLTLDDDTSTNGLKVFSITYSTFDNESSDGRKASATGAVCACVNGSGELDGYIHLNKLTTKLNNIDLLSAMDREVLDEGFMHADKREKIECMKRLEEFIVEHSPKVIIVAAENKDAIIIMDDLRQLIRRMEEKNIYKESINLELIDNEMPKLFEQSKTAESEFSQKSGTGRAIPALVKQAVALARLIQDPLLCYTQLCNTERDVLSLKLHPMLQTIIAASGSRTSDDAQQLLNLLEIEFINLVNDVGVDLNRCNQEPHTSNCLQYVCGLGPRKAQYVLKILKQQRLEKMGQMSSEKQSKTYPVAQSRLFLVTKCGFGRRVLINSAGFIKFDVDKIKAELEEYGEEEDENDVELLDSTRIHPETYEWARKMAIDALDFDETSDSANSQSALREILYENSKRLKDLDLDAFAAELIRTGYGDKTVTLYDIRSELCSRYRDRREAYQPMNDETKFYCLIKETQQSFYVGKLIMCRVSGIARKRPNREQLDEANPYKDDNTCMWVCSFCKKADFNDLSKVWSHFDTGECPGPPVGVRTVIDNGCNGFIPLKFLSDSTVTNPEDRIKVGMVIHSRIRRIDPDRFSCELTSKTSDLRDVADQWKPKKDDYHDRKAEQEDQDKLEEKKKKEEHKQTYTKRVIAHPQFKNIGYQQAVNMLREMDIGDCIIRPSSKGSDHLTVTWKVNKNCYQHVDVLEEKKMNAFSIGKRLIIDGEDFEDLDEILARYVQPMANYVREVMAHKNYKDMNDLNSSFSQLSTSDQTQPNASMQAHVQNSQIEAFLLDERIKNPNRIPYVFTCCQNYPGKFMISYMIKLKTRTEYITVTHEGFKFRLKMFRTFNELITWFKQHFNDPLPVNLTQQYNNSQATNVASQQMTQNTNQNSQQFNMNSQSQIPPMPSNIPSNIQYNKSSAFDDVAFGGNNSSSMNSSQPVDDWNESSAMDTFRSGDNNDSSYGKNGGGGYSNSDGFNRGGRGRGGYNDRGGFRNDRGGGGGYRGRGGRDGGEGRGGGGGYRGRGGGGGGEGGYRGRGGGGGFRGGRGDFRNNNGSREGGDDDRRGGRYGNNSYNDSSTYGNSTNANSSYSNSGSSNQAVNNINDDDNWDETPYVQTQNTQPPSQNYFPPQAPAAPPRMPEPVRQPVINNDDEMWD